MAQPLMPKATAVWLIDNTTLTFEQVADFCGLHMLEVKAIADGDVAGNIVGANPIASGELTAEEIERAEKTPRAKLKMAKSDLPKPKARSKGPRYTPVSKRADKPDGIAWLLKEYPQLSDSQICRLIGTTKPTIAAVRDRTHPNSPNIRARSPLSLGLCNADDLEKAVKRADRAAERAAGGKKAKKAAPEAADEAAQDNPAAAIAAEG